MNEEDVKLMARLQLANEYELPFEVGQWKGCARNIELCFCWKDTKGKYSPFPSCNIELHELHAGALKVICGPEIAEFEKELIERILYMSHEAGRFTGND